MAREAVDAIGDLEPLTALEDAVSKTVDPHPARKMKPPSNAEGDLLLANPLSWISLARRSYHLTAAPRVRRLFQNCRFWPMWLRDRPKPPPHTARRTPCLGGPG